ncbi:MAG TPA: epoxyqueuosine reductase [Phycisphaerae bacterium]|nr:epoxyqueuosine reductase [Phycisphaerae bacterium]
MTDSLKTELISSLKQAGAYDIRIANPDVGFAHALEGRHPRQLMPGCRSVIVFAVAMGPETNNTSLGPLPAKDIQISSGRPVEPANIKPAGYNVTRLSTLFRAQVKLAGVTFLHDRGFEIRHGGQLKLCAYEAGIGRYGRSGLILHPQLGNRMCLGVILTDAEMPADTKREDHDPCRNCDLCVRSCPAGAFDPDKTYPDSWSFDICMPKRKEIAAEGSYCHNCFAACPAGQYKDEDLLFLAESKSYFNNETRAEIDVKTKEIYPKE